jgi:O-antigen/teichoic acid export membrane protein
MALFMSVFTRIDALMIRNLSPNLMGLVGLDSGYFQAGIYAQSYRLLDAGLIFSTLLSTQLLPIFSKNIKEGKDNTVFVWLSFRLVWLVGLTALFTAYIFGDDILELLYGAKWEGGPETALAVRSHQIFIYLMGAFVAMSSIHIFGTFITAEGRMKWLTFLALAAMGLNMGINFWLIPMFGAMGAALSALITQWFFAVACAMRVWRSGTIQTQGIKWKVIPMSAFHGLVLALGVYRVNGLPQREIVEVVTWLLFMIGLVWMLFGLDIAALWRNRKSPGNKVL